MADDEKFVCSLEIFELARQIKEVTDTGVTLITPEVEAVIRNRITDENQTHRLLNQLLDYAGMSEKGLALFKRLCRYYFTTNPQVTAEYVYLYRDLYDSDAEGEDDRT